MIHFTTTLSAIGSVTILRVPKDEGQSLPSRGMVYIKGTMNGIAFDHALEPDGKGSHWMKMEDKLLKKINVRLGDRVTLDIESTKDIPEPDVPEDILKAVSSDKKINELWKATTSMARWDWIRWIVATKNPDTRKKRIEVELSKLRKGMKRPCCFNRSMCCDFTICNAGVLPES